ncbi:hypothetical protein [Amycolatopsis cihanbeyliensis]|uniref:Uncharacterized protein n=1 Tax=Amycolatopsis cihanbeyliensis TaxID=1128664 RepID=A0A542DKJ3_AMYCI|nr:hypothetical protein [Amycolatopsis cihanbeyliensis]TQJ03611.1 hypothetical protein FB471_3373 [Amycolatopsis cihanbeyliensis]
MTEPADDADAASSAEHERLLAEALRAQARSAPQSDRPREFDSSAFDSSTFDNTSIIGPKPAVPAAEVPHSYGLLSGPAANSLEHERAALESMEARAGEAEPEQATVEQRVAGPAPLPVRWILLLAVLLGLAAGSVIGLLTLI